MNMLSFLLGASTTALVTTESGKRITESIGNTLIGVAKKAANDIETGIKKELENIESASQTIVDTQEVK